MSQLRTMVLSICFKWSMTRIITTIGAPLVVARHRELPFIDCQDENGHSIVDLSNMWRLSPLTRNTTWFSASLIITKYDFNTTSFTLWARLKASQVYESRRLPGLWWIFCWSGGNPNRVFVWTNGMWHDLSIIFNEIVLSNKFSFESQHYLEDYYIRISAFIYTLELLGLQLLKCSLANRFCWWHYSLLKLLKAPYRPF